MVILYCFGDKARYWSKITFFQLTHSSCSLQTDRQTDRRDFNKRVFTK